MHEFRMQWPYCQSSGTNFPPRVFPLNFDSRVPIFLNIFEPVRSETKGAEFIKVVIYEDRVRGAILIYKEDCELLEVIENGVGDL